MSGPFPAALPPAFAQVLPALRCPVCRQRLAVDGRALTCPAGHAFDLAKQGYVNLTAGRHPGTGDSTSMVQARARFLDAGHYSRLSEALAARAGHAGHAGSGLVLDLAGGTGHHLAAVLDRLPGRYGAVLDLSGPALRRAARAHPRAVAVGADAWGRLPVADGAAALVLNVFGPRDPAELERVLAPGGVLVTASPLPDHLAELRGPLGMIGIDPDKEGRRATAFARFTRVADGEVRYPLELTHADVADLAGMGPSALHTDDAERAARVAGLPPRVSVTVAVRVSSYTGSYTGPTNQLPAT